MRPQWNNRTPKHTISVAMLRMTVISACSARFSSSCSILDERVEIYFVQPTFIKMAGTLLRRLSRCRTFGTFDRSASGSGLIRAV